MHLFYQFITLLESHLYDIIVKLVWTTPLSHERSFLNRQFVLLKDQHDVMHMILLKQVTFCSSGEVNGGAHVMGVPIKCRC